jgi:very-short-patch-repair endonuclease
MLMAQFENEKYCCVRPVRQYKYLPDRKYKADFAWPGFMLAVEVDGSVHRIKERFAEDCRRQNELKFAGWHVFRVTGAMVRSGEAIKVVLRALDWAERRRKPFPG